MSKELKNLRRSALLGSAATLLASFALGTGVTAQDADADLDLDFEEVTVTGSRIVRRDLTAPSPITTIGAEEFQLSGAQNVEQVLAGLPQTIPGFGGSSNNPGNGTATVNLRGLGTARTLVLVNGRRWVASNEAGVVDLNTIPSALIERVEVMTGGASAVYGSDAMAGVVNFKLKEDFEGLEVSGQYTTTGHGDAEVYTTDLIVGGNFADGRGNVTTFVNYWKREALFQGDRKRSQYDLWDGCAEPGTQNVTTGGDYVGGDFFDALLNFDQEACDNLGGELGFIPGGSTTIPEGRIGNTSFTSDGGVVDGYVPYNYAPTNYLQLPGERFEAHTSANYQINDSVRFFSEATFVDARVDTQLAATPAVLSGAVLDIDSPFLNADGQAFLATLEDPDNPGYTTPQTLRRRMLEVGPRSSDNTRTSYRILAGFDGEIGDGWNYETYYVYNRLNATENLGNDINATRYRQALLTEVDDDGNLVCVDQSDGCVPINPFGLGNISEEAADFVRIGGLKSEYFETQVAAGSISGTLGDWTGAGEVGVAIGVEWRKNTSQHTPDQNFIDGNVLGFNTDSIVGGSYNSKEVFAEIVIPVVDMLDVEAKARYSDYSTVGGVWSYAGGMTFRPIDGLQFRGQYQRSVRAPNINELFSGQVNGFPPASDPCAQGGTAPAALCQATGTNGNEFTFASNNQVEGLFGGNPDLSEETSDTITIGAVWSPEFVPGLNLTIDYYDITVDDYISVLGGSVSNVLSLCYEQLQDANSIYCQAINRTSEGEIDYVEVLNANVSKVETSGIDFTADYNMDVDFGFFEGGSTLNFNLLTTRVIENITYPIQEDPENFDDCAGYFGPTCGRPDPKWRANLRATMINGPLTLSTRIRWIDSVLDYRFESADDYVYAAIPSYWTADISFTYDVNETLQVFGGANNVFNKHAPQTGDYDQQANTYPETYDAIGTRLFLGAKVRF